MVRRAHGILSTLPYPHKRPFCTPTQARHHYLIMPREFVADIYAMGRQHATMIRHLQEKAYALNKRILETNPSIKFRTGFHAVPSMKQVRSKADARAFL